ncbi:MAG: hypothetical protein LCI00_22640 [Chloroflexi bacterium]|nr:hypothetical protein [Chloroflexota bacterium]MCC6895266.1 hypothetical protein [Anaerolineae bacterium]
MTTIFLPVYDKLLDFLVEKATPAEILSFQVSDEEKELAQDLVERKSAGLLTSSEEGMLEQMAEFDLLVTILKAKAQKAYQQS